MKRIALKLSASLAVHESVNLHKYPQSAYTFIEIRFNHLYTYIYAIYIIIIQDLRALKLNADFDILHDCVRLELQLTFDWFIYFENFEKPSRNEYTRMTGKAELEPELESWFGNGKREQLLSRRSTRVLQLLSLVLLLLLLILVNPVNKELFYQLCVRRYTITDA